MDIGFDGGIGFDGRTLATGASTGAALATGCAAAGAVVRCTSSGNVSAGSSDATAAAPLAVEPANRASRGHGAAEHEMRWR